METLKPTPADLASDASRFSGSVVMLEGLLTVQGRKMVNLIVDPAASKIRVTIHDPGFVDRMLENVPGWVGGPYLYYDNATLEGTLSVGKAYEIELQDIKAIRISREDRSLDFSSKGG